MTLAARAASGRGRPRPAAGWSRGIDATVSGTVALLALLVTSGGADGDLQVRAVGDVGPVELLGALVVGGVLWWRRSHPLAVLVATIAVEVLALASGWGDLFGIASLVALYAVARYTPELRASLAAVAAVAAVTVLSAVLDGQTAVGDLGLSAGVVALTWYVGRRVRLREEAVASLRRAHAAEAVVDERSRIARELHDVVAHRVSLMTVQAGAARTVAVTDPHGAAEAMRAVEEAGRRTLDELRHLLGVLRPDADVGRLDPQRGLADVPDLVAQLRSAGLDVAVITDGASGELPARVELAAYRVVQEALTNVLKHAGPGTHVQVRLTTDAAGVDVEVLDDGRGSGVLDGAGHGIIGMRERAALLGGHVQAGPRAGGGFRVVAHLPAGGDGR